jgi:hypothetical protein
MPIIFYEIIGWTGTMLILLAYLLVSIQKITPVSKTYQLLNLFGAAFVIVNVSFHGAIPSVALNLVWLVVALYGLIKSDKISTR